MVISGLFSSMNLPLLRSDSGRVKDLSSVSKILHEMNDTSKHSAKLRLGSNRSSVFEKLHTACHQSIIILQCIRAKL